MKSLYIYLLMLFMHIVDDFLSAREEEKIEQLEFWRYDD